MPTHAHGPERFREAKVRGRGTLVILLVGLLGGCAQSRVHGTLDRFDRAYEDSLILWTPDLPPGVVGKEYRFAVNARGQPKPFRWKLVSGNLPEGIALDGEGVLHGKPTQAGLSSFVVKVACTPAASLQPRGQAPHVDWRMRSYSLLVKAGPAGDSGSLPGVPKAEGRSKP